MIKNIKRYQCLVQYIYFILVFQLFKKLQIEDVLGMIYKWQIWRNEEKKEEKRFFLSMVIHNLW